MFLSGPQPWRSSKPGLGFQAGLAAAWVLQTAFPGWGLGGKLNRGPSGKSKGTVGRGLPAGPLHARGLGSIACHSPGGCLAKYWTSLHCYCCCCLRGGGDQQGLTGAVFFLLRGGSGNCDWGRGWAEQGRGKAGGLQRWRACTPGGQWPPVLLAAPG